MRQETKQKLKVGKLVLLGIVLALVINSAPALAVDKYLNAVAPGTYYWTTPTNWSPVGVPAGGDNVYLTKNDIVTYTVYYHIKPATLQLLDFRVGNTGGGTVNFYHGYWSDPASTLLTQNEYIGGGGKGSYNQNLGTNICNQMVIGSLGTYNLIGSGTLQANQLFLNSGGTFNQIAGVVNADFSQNGGTVLGNFTNNWGYTYNTGTFSGRLINQGNLTFNNQRLYQRQHRLHCHGRWQSLWRDHHQLWRHCRRQRLDHQQYRQPWLAGSRHRPEFKAGRHGDQRGRRRDYGAQ